MQWGGFQQEKSRRHEVNNRAYIFVHVRMLYEIPNGKRSTCKHVPVHAYLLGRIYQYDERKLRVTGSACANAS